MPEPDIDPGTFVFLTKENCPSCKAFKKQESVRSALDSGDAIELQPDDKGYGWVREAADVDVLPGVVEYTGHQYAAIGGE